MDNKELTAALQEALDDLDVEDEIRRVETFEEVGMLTNDAGLVITMQDGSEFQVTIVQSRLARG